MENNNYTFKEICEKTGYKSSVIRYYEKEFEINIPRDANGRRIFTQQVYEILSLIKKLQTDGYTNKQIKKLLYNNDKDQTDETAVTAGYTEANEKQDFNEEILKTLDSKLDEIKNNIQEINQNVNTKERDILISENLKLKMEIKQKTYEIIELKENLRYEKEKKKSFFPKLFHK
ncbi:MAG TPA: MerR family transcriptional regulator [Clostridiaceae bacterium]|jgi:DNA-binding transcriptional MerR regulator|nr:MerR family transcriptional regulator [Clostridiaceae bacterium]HBN29456.1 MerR family transcriptional regulator [Clostridiaceae bacterium]HCL51071.1 MerR family transcriptional regulator [Clostridiaceae bacterium]